jgi:hypothetical protein
VKRSSKKNKNDTFHWKVVPRRIYKAPFTVIPVPFVPWWAGSRQAYVCACTASQRAGESGSQCGTDAQCTCTGAGVVLTRNLRATASLLLLRSGSPLHLMLLEHQARVESLPIVQGFELSRKSKHTTEFVVQIQWATHYGSNSSRWRLQHVYHFCSSSCTSTGNQIYHNQIMH